jgi:hypothetical protein
VEYRHFKKKGQGEKGQEWEEEKEMAEFALKNQGKFPILR